LELDLSSVKRESPTNENEIFPSFLFAMKVAPGEADFTKVNGSPINPANYNSVETSSPI
jgi:hypothetical protein